MTKRTLTLTAAILMALNTMIGGGIFVNPRQLAIAAGALSPLGYLVGALLMFPLILSIAELARLKPVSGGLYVYSKSYVAPFAGFLSGWAYFLSKSTSAAFLVHTVNTFFRNHFIELQSVPPFILDALLIGLLTSLHIFGVSIAGNLPYLFSVMKFTPLIFGLIAGFVLFDPINLSVIPADVSLSTISTVIPVCLYALIGFEVICSIGGFIENPSKNIRRTILSACAVISVVTVLFQLGMVAALGGALPLAPEPMFALASSFVGSHVWLAKLMNGLVFASISGGAFFMLGSNCWNLYTLAKDRTLPGANILTKQNKFGAPWVALVIQGLTALTMISITTQQLALQNMVVFSLFSCFLMTCFAAVNAGRKGLLSIPLFVPICAIGTCSYVISMCFLNIIKYGVSASFLSFFVAGVTAGIVMKCTKKVDQPLDLAD